MTIEWTHEFGEEDMGENSIYYLNPTCPHYKWWVTIVIWSLNINIKLELLSHAPWSICALPFLNANNHRGSILGVFQWYSLSDILIAYLSNLPFSINHLQSFLQATHYDNCTHLLWQWSTAIGPLLFHAFATSTPTSLTAPGLHSYHKASQWHWCPSPMHSSSLW